MKKTVYKPEERMNIRKTVALLTAAMLCIVMVGCSAQPAANDGSSAGEPASVTPAPTPTPAPKEGLEAVFDKAEINVAMVSNGDEAASSLFFEAAKREAEGMGLTVTTNAAGSGFDAAVKKAAESADILVAFMPEKGSASALSGLSIPVAVFTVGDASGAPQEISYLSYDSSKELDLAFNAALVYPPHDAPVRLMLMFESADSGTHAAYQALYDQGMIFPKETYIAAEAEGGAGEWLTGKLDSYVEGMMDAVFAEDPALAVSAGDALATLTRTDMEVFCPGITPDIVSRMQSSPDVFAQGIGRNDALAGMLCVRAALGMLKGGAAVSKTFEPTIIDAANIGDDAVASMEAMDADSAALYNESWMDELRAYYSAA
jgi:hypothetical protein